MWPRRTASTARTWQSSCRLLVEGGHADEMVERMFEAITARLPIGQRVDDIALLVLRIS